MLDFNNIPGLSGELAAGLTGNPNIARDFLISMRRYQVSEEDRSRLSSINATQWESLLKIVSEDEYLMSLAKRSGDAKKPIDLSLVEQAQATEHFQRHIKTAGLTEIFLTVTLISIVTIIGFFILLAGLIVALSIATVISAAAVVLTYIVFFVMAVLLLATFLIGVIIALLSLISGADLEEARAAGTSIYGGPGGISGEMPHDAEYITGIDVYVGLERSFKVIRGLSIYYIADGGLLGRYDFGTIGSLSDCYYRFDIPNDCELVGVHVKYGIFVDSLKFSVRNKETGIVTISKSFGGDGGVHEGDLMLPGAAPVRGFFARSGSCIDAIGVCDSSHSGVMVGGMGGRPFFDDQGVEAKRLKSVHVREGSVIDAIAVEWELSGGQTASGIWHGGSGGQVKNKLEIAADDSIKSIEVFIGWHRGYEVITRLKFTLRSNKSVTFGENNGYNRTETIACPSNRTVFGFFGRSGVYLDALGICVH